MSLARVYVPARDAREVAHEALHAMISRCADVDRDLAAEWLTDAVRRAADAYRGRQRRIRRREVALEDVDAPDTSRDPERTLVSAQIASRVRTAVSSLRPERASVVRAVDLDGRSMADVAREQDVPESAVRRRLADGRAEVEADLSRQRAAERRRTGGATSWIAIPMMADARDAFRRAVAILRRTDVRGLAALGATAALVAAGGDAPTLSPTPDEAPPREYVADTVRVATPLPQAERRAEVAPVVVAPVVVAGRARHDAAARFRAELKHE